MEKSLVLYYTDLRAYHLYDPGGFVALLGSKNGKTSFYFISLYLPAENSNLLFIICFFRLT